MVKTVTSIQVTANDTVAFYNGTDVVMTLSQIMPPSVYIDYTNTSIVIYNQANSSDEKTRFEFPAVYVQQVGANSYTKLNSYALQTEITSRVMQVYKDLTTEIFKGCCEAGGCQADGCSILYRYNSELNEGDWYYDSEGGVLRISMNSFSNQLFDSLLPAMPIDSWVTFISSADSTLYAVFQITNAGTIVGGYVEYEATLVDGSSSFPVNTVFCFNLMAAGGSPVIGITSGNAGINVGGSYPSYTISNAMTVAAGTGITVTGSYPNYVINSNAAGVTLSSAGGTESLVNDGTGPTLAIKGVTAGSGISLSSTGAELTISSTGGSVTSVGLSMPPAFTVTNSPVTGSGTLTATANGNSSQYIDGTGSLQIFPSPQGLQSVITTNNNLTTTNTIIGNNNSLTWSGNNKFEIFPEASGYFLVTVGKYPPNESQIKVTALTAEMFTTAATTQKFKTDSTTLYIQTPNVSSGAASAGQVLTLGNATTGAVEYTTITSNPGTVTNVSASVPSPTSPALSVNVTNPTSTPSIAITANGTSSQLIDGTGALQTIPTGLPPTGAAGGDLSGNYPNPEVHKVHGIDLQSGTPTSGDVWVYGGSPEKWQHQMLHASQVDNDSGVTGTHVDDALDNLESAITNKVNNTLTISTTAPLSGGGDLTANRTLSITQASSTTNGYLSSTDWNTFNGKVSAGSLNYFGDGSAGVVTITSNSATLLADTYYQDLTITGSGSLNCKGFRVFVSGTLDLTGAGASAIHQNGITGNSATGFAGSLNGLLGKVGLGRTVYGGAEGATGNASEIVGGNGGSSGSTNGVAGGTATAAATNNFRIGGSGGAGGKGGNASGGTGGNGSAGQVNGGAGPASGYLPLIRTIGIFGLFSHVELSTSGAAVTTLLYPGLNGGGGGGGAGNGASGGGGGGAGGGGGGNLFIYAKTVSIGASTNAEALCANGASGGNGAAGQNANTAAGGGAGGGGGGYVYLLCNAITGGNYTFISANGGTGGTGGTGLGTGIGGQGGTGGSGGRITVIKISSGTITQVNGTTNAGTTPTAPTSGTAGTAGGSGGTCTYTA